MLKLIWTFGNMPTKDTPLVSIGWEFNLVVTLPELNSEFTEMHALLRFCLWCGRVQVEGLASCVPCGPEVTQKMKPLKDCLVKDSKGNTGITAPLLKNPVELPKGAKSQMLSAMVRLLYINLERIRFGPRMNKKPFLIVFEDWAPGKIEHQQRKRYLKAAGGSTINPWPV